MIKKSFSIVLVAILVMTFGPAVAKRTPPVLTRITPAPEHIDLDRTITNLLSIYHYRRTKPDDRQSGAILDAYLAALDFNRSFLLASDLREFDKYRDQLDDYLLNGYLEPAYEIFNVYLKRLAERTARIQERLDQPFDFHLDEAFELDREEAPWARSQAELDEIWRKRLKNELLLLTLAGKELDEARETLKTRYEGRLRRTSQYKSQDVFQLYMNAVAASYDPHTAYFSPRATENFNIQMRLSLQGIGTVLRIEDEQITVVELVPGGPAAMSGGLHPKDRIVGVGQGDEEDIIDVVGWRLDDVVDLIRGQRGTVVRLEIVPADAGLEGGHKIVRLVRDTIRLEQQAAQGEVKTVSTQAGELRIGIVKIPTFYSDFAAAQRGDDNYRSTTRDVRRILTELQTGKGVDGVVIDLRQNGGGSLQEAIELSGLFIPEGPVVQVRNATGNVEVETDPDPRLVYDGPLAVLVNRFSASASEIFAGAMQDYGRAVVLGSPTFGKGTVQTLVNLNRFVSKPNAPPLGQLKLTIAKFYRVSGSSTQHRGVVPDILFPSLYETDEVGESAQEYALPWDEITPVRYRPGQAMADLIAQLEHNYKQRIKTDEGFKQLLEEIDEITEARNKKTVSLQESKRREEREQALAKRLERENLRRQIQGLEPLNSDQELADDDSDNDTTGPDPLLEESARIVADMITLSDHRAVVMTQ